MSSRRCRSITGGHLITGGLAIRTMSRMCCAIILSTSRKHSRARGAGPRVGQALSPASAEAATPQAQPQATGMSRLQELEAHLARLEGQPVQQPVQQPPEAICPSPRPPALRWSRTRLQGLSWAARACRGSPDSPSPSDAPVVRLAMGDPTEAASEAEAAATIAERGQRQTQPQNQAPATPAPMTVQGQLGAMGPLEPRAAQAIQGRVHEQGIPLSAVPAIAVNTVGTVGGAALGAPLGPVGSAAGAALGGSLATRANTALGLAPQEKPLLETPWANVYPSDLLGPFRSASQGQRRHSRARCATCPGRTLADMNWLPRSLSSLGSALGQRVPHRSYSQKPLPRAGPCRCRHYGVPPEKSSGKRRAWRRALSARKPCRRGVGS